MVRRMLDGAVMIHHTKKGTIKTIEAIIAIIFPISAFLAMNMDKVCALAFAYKFN